MASIPLCSKSDPGRSKAESAERLVNLYAEAQVGGKSAFALYATPGLRQFAVPALSPCRGLMDLTSSILSIHFDSAFTVNNAGVAAVAGAVGGIDRVIMARNQHRMDDGTEDPQVAIAAGGQYYVYQTDTTALIIQDFITGVNSVETIDGYTIIALSNGKFYWTSLNDAKTINPLHFATAEGSPDSLLRAIRFRQELWLMGSDSIEVWRDTGVSTSQFERLPGAVLDVGVLSKYAACRMGTNLYFVDNAKQVRQVSSGYSAQRISNYGCEAAIRSLASVDDLEMFGYSESGHEFLVVKSPTFTWVWDSATTNWHERQTIGFLNWQAQGFCRSFGFNVVGSTISGKLLIIDQDALSEDNLDIRCEATLPPASAFPKGATLNALDVDVQSGVGIGAESGRSQDIDPVIGLDISIDNGATFYASKTQHLGKQGRRRHVVRFTRLGRMDRQGVTFRLWASARVMRAILQVDLTALPRSA